MDDFETISSQLNEALRKKNEACQRIPKFVEETMNNLEVVGSKLNFNIYEARDNFKLKAQEALVGRNETRALKEECKAAKSSMDQKVSQIKQEIDQVIEENKQLEEKYRENNLPLILALMGSHRPASNVK